MNNMNDMNTPAAAPVQAPQNMKIDEKAIKKMAGQAVTKTPGVLGLAGGLPGMLKLTDDTTMGLDVTLSEDNKKVAVSAKVITEYGKNIPQIVEDVTHQVTETLQTMAGLSVEKVEVEVTDTMTAADYQARQNRTPGKN